MTHQQVWIAKMTGTHREVTQEHVPLPRIYKVWNVPQFGSADADYLDLVSSCLGEGKTSRLYKRLIYDDQIASDVTVYNDAREIGGQFYIQVTARPGHDLDEIEKEIDEELARFLKEGPTPTELERVRTRYMATLPARHRAHRRVRRKIRPAGGVCGLHRRPGRLQGDTQTRARGHRRRPEVGGQPLAGGRGLHRRGPAVPGLQGGGGRCGPLAMRQTLGAAAELKLPKLQRATLSNGLKVILAERHEVPLVNFWLAADAGYAADQFASPGTAKLTGTLLIDGTHTRSALEISDQTALLGRAAPGLFQSRLLVCAPLGAEAQARSLPRPVCRCHPPSVVSGGRLQA